MIDPAPTAFAPMMALRPTAPVPNTTSERPSATPTELIAAPAPVITPQPSGPRISSGAVLSTFTALRSWQSA